MGNKVRGSPGKHKGLSSGSLHIDPGSAQVRERSEYGAAAEQILRAVGTPFSKGPGKGSVPHYRAYPLLASWKRFRVLRVRTALGGPEPLVIW